MWSAVLQGPDEAVRGRGKCQGCRIHVFFPGQSGILRTDILQIQKGSNEILSGEHFEEKGEPWNLRHSTHWKLLSNAPNFHLFPTLRGRRATKVDPNPKEDGLWG